MTSSFHLRRQVSLPETWLAGGGISSPSLSQKLTLFWIELACVLRTGTMPPPPQKHIQFVLHSQEWVAESEQPSRFARQGLLGGDT